MMMILVATVALGLSAAGIVLGVGRLTRIAVPRFLAPAAAGVAMAAFMLWNEYTWFERARMDLPEGARVAETYEHASWVQPWTLAVPRVTRFAAVSVEDEVARADADADADAGAGAGTEAADDDALAGPLRRGWVVLAARFEGHQRIPVLFDCAAGRRAALGEAAMARLDAGRAPDPASLDWVAGDGEDPLIAAACARGTS